MSSAFPNFSLITISLTIILLVAIFIKKLNKVLIFVFLLAAVVPVAMSCYFNSFSSALISKDIAVKEGPSKIFESFKTAPAGTKVFISRVHQGWALIKLPSDLRGWIPEQELLRFEGDNE